MGFRPPACSARSSAATVPANFALIPKPVVPELEAEAFVGAVPSGADVGSSVGEERDGEDIPVTPANPETNKVAPRAIAAHITTDARDIRVAKAHSYIYNPNGC